MKVHPLFSGFKGECAHAVGAALGFSVHVETARGPLPEVLPGHQQIRLQEGGDMRGFRFAGGWDATGVHCLLFVRPLTVMAATWFQVGCDHACGAVTFVPDLSVCTVHFASPPAALRAPDAVGLV